MIITIDGPVASGKSSVARLLADELGFYYLYTGFFYRGLAYILVHHYGYNDDTLHNPSKEDIDESSDRRRFVYEYCNGKADIVFDGVSLGASLKSADVDRWSSLLSTSAYVRHIILKHQIFTGQTHNLVADGRDTGTVVFPDAEHKFFLTAGVEIRANRWRNDQSKQGLIYSFDESLKAIMERDNRDKNRSLSPLIPASDARVIDNSQLTIQETVALMRSYIIYI